MKKQSFRKRLYCSVVAILSLFAFCGSDLHAVNNGGPEVTVSTNNSLRSTQANVTYNLGLFDTGSVPQTQAVAKGATIAVTDMGVGFNRFVLLGWHTTQTKPLLVATRRAEEELKSTDEFYAIGDLLTVTDDTTLYAVWAMDMNKDGYPDYPGAIIIKPSFAKVGKLPVDSNGLLLRSGAVVSGWNDDYDLQAYYDSVYHVGCWYNIDPDRGITDPLITLDRDYSFNGGDAYATVPMDLVIEYDGVLDDTCMINGNTGKVMDRISIAVNPTYPMDSVLIEIPFMFRSIQKDGQGILKMYFVQPGTDILVTSADWTWQNMPAWPKPFIDPHTGVYTDTCVIKFNIYNKPVFESNVINQHVNLQGELDLKHLSGTPLKHMMRCIDGLAWRPAGSPVTKIEQEEIRDSASICLRETDLLTGYQVYSKEFYLSYKFNKHDWSAVFAAFEQECHVTGYIELMRTLEAAHPVDFYDPLPNGTFIGGGPGANYAAITFGGHIINDAVPRNDDPAYIIYGMDVFSAILMSDPAYFATIQDYLDAATVRADAEWYTVLGKRKADMIKLPNADERCGPMHCFIFNPMTFPVIEREIEIVNPVPGVTVVPGEGKHYVKSRDDFGFTLTFAGGAPLKVIGTRLNSETSEELQGTDLGGGTFSYIIPQVQEPWLITVTSEPANANEDITGGRVWTYANTLYISSDKAVRANVYTLSGSLYKQLDVPAGTVSESLERGVYIIEIDGARYKVVVK